MNESLFVQFKDFFKAIAKTIEERVNGKKTAQTYMYKQMLTEELSVDLKWNTLTVNSNIVAADVVALDSSLPLKRRDTFGTASGDIPKLGMKMQMSEKQMSDIDVLKARNVETAVLVDKIFADQGKCIMGIHEKLEYMFHQGLSTGVTLIDDDSNVGTGIRIDYGYKEENKFGASVVWSDVANAKPIDDIRRIVKQAKANGDMPAFILMDDATFDNLAANQQTREQYAFSQNFVGTQIPVPDLAQVNDMMMKRYKLTIIVIDRTVTVERDGKRTVLTPWESGKVILLESLKVGKLMYGILAEETRKSPKCLYEKSGSFILLKKWSSDDPFAEFTSSQALVVPVINNVNSIYQLDSEEAQSTGGQTEDNATITIYEDSTVLRTNLINALNSANVKSKPAATSDDTDVELIALVNKLSDAKETILKAILEIPVVNAGSDSTSSSATKALLGTATAAGSKTIASVAWSQVSGPNTASFSAGTALSTNATGLVTGTYVFKLTATDSEGTTASDTVSIVATVA